MGVPGERRAEVVVERGRRKEKREKKEEELLGERLVGHPHINQDFPSPTAARPALPVMCFPCRKESEARVKREATAPTPPRWKGKKQDYLRSRNLAHFLLPVTIPPFAAERRQKIVCRGRRQCPPHLGGTRRRLTCSPRHPTPFQLTVLPVAEYPRSSDLNHPLLPAASTLRCREEAEDREGDNSALNNLLG